jgi:hypothetical protein
MVSRQIFEIPSELSLLEFLEVEPLEAMPDDGYWCYELIDQFGTMLKLSFNTHERSLQTIVLKDHRKTMSVSQEGAVRLSIIEAGAGYILRGDFQYQDAFSMVEIQIKPEIVVCWSTLLSVVS